MAMGDSRQLDSTRNRGAVARAAAMLHSLDILIMWLLTAVVGLIFACMMVAVFVAVIFREAFGLPFPWFADVSRYSLIWLVFLGSAVLARRGEHICIDLLHKALPPLGRRLVNITVCIVGIVLSSYFAFLGTRFTVLAFQQGQTSASTYLPAWIGYLAIPLGLGLMALAYLLYLVEVPLPGNHRFRLLGGTFGR